MGNIKQPDDVHRHFAVCDVQRINCSQSRGGNGSIGGFSFPFQRCVVHMCKGRRGKGKSDVFPTEGPLLYQTVRSRQSGYSDPNAAPNNEQPYFHKQTAAFVQRYSLLIASLHFSITAADAACTKATARFAVHIAVSPELFATAVQQSFRSISHCAVR